MGEAFFWALEARLRAGTKHSAAAARLTAEGLPTEAKAASSKREAATAEDMAVVEQGGARLSRAEFEALVEQAQSNLPKDRLETLAYHKAADDGKVHEALHGRGVKPVIQNRNH